MKRLAADNGKVNERSEKLTERQSHTSQSHAISMKESACPTFLLMLERLYMYNATLKLFLIK